MKKRTISNRKKTVGYERYESHRVDNARHEFLLIRVCSSDSCVFPIGTTRRECLARTHLLQLWLQILPL